MDNCLGCEYYCVINQHCNADREFCIAEIEEERAKAINKFAKVLKDTTRANENRDNAIWDEEYFAKFVDDVVEQLKEQKYE